jgi:hypothetical protein
MNQLFNIFSKIPKYQNTKIPKYQNTKIPKYKNTKIQKNIHYIYNARQ